MLNNSLHELVLVERGHEAQVVQRLGLVVHQVAGLIQRPQLVLHCANHRNVMRGRARAHQSSHRATYIVGQQTQAIGGSHRRCFVQSATHADSAEHNHVARREGSSRTWIKFRNGSCLRRRMRLSKLRSAWRSLSRHTRRSCSMPLMLLWMSSRVRPCHAWQVPAAPHLCDSEHQHTARSDV